MFSALCSIAIEFVLYTVLKIYDLVGLSELVVANIGGGGRAGKLLDTLAVID